MDTINKSYETENRTGVNQQGPRANTPVRRLTATSIIGDSVENREGEKLGEVNNIMLNIDDGSIEYIVLEFGSFLGMGGKLFAIPFNEMYLDTRKKVFVIDRSKEYLKSIPGFDPNHWPETNDHRYYEDVNDYWRSVNTTPR